MFIIVKRCWDFLKAFKVASHDECMPWLTMTNRTNYLNSANVIKVKR